MALREIKSDDRPWFDEGEGGVRGEAALREEFERALAEGERVLIIWARPAGNGELSFSHVENRRQGAKVSFAEFMAVLQGVVYRYFRDMVR